MFVRCQARRPNSHGTYPGVFGLVNGLALGGNLSEMELAAWRDGNSWFNAAYPDPSKSVPGIYDPELNPQAAAWFKDTATHLIERVEPYLEMLRQHNVEFRKLVSNDPGIIVYEDSVQVVVVPYKNEY